RAGRAGDGDARRREAHPHPPADRARPALTPSHPRGTPLPAPVPRAPRRPWTRGGELIRNVRHIRHPKSKIGAGGMGEGAQVTATPMSTPTRYVARAAAPPRSTCRPARSEEHTSELQSRENLVCRLLLEKKNDGARRVHRAE